MPINVPPRVNPGMEEVAKDETRPFVEKRRPFKEEATVKTPLIVVVASVVVLEATRGPANVEVPADERP